MTFTDRLKKTFGIPIRRNIITRIREAIEIDESNFVYLSGSVITESDDIIVFKSGKKYTCKQVNYVGSPVWEVLRNYEVGTTIMGRQR